MIYTHDFMLSNSHSGKCGMVPNINSIRKKIMLTIIRNLVLSFMEFDFKTKVKYTSAYLPGVLDVEECKNLMKGMNFC